MDIKREVTMDLARELAMHLGMDVLQLTDETPVDGSTASLLVRLYGYVNYSSDSKAFQISDEAVYSFGQLKRVIAEAVLDLGGVAR
jgi:hypothetical protein